MALGFLYKEHCFLLDSPDGKVFHGIEDNSCSNSEFEDLR